MSEEELREYQEKYDEDIKNGYIKNTYLDNGIFIEEFLLRERAQGIEGTIKDYDITSLKPAKIGRATKKRWRIEDKEDAKRDKSFKELKKSLEGYDAKYFQNCSEAEIEDKIISPVLNILGFSYKKQESITIYEQQLRPDYLLFPYDKVAKEYEEKGLERTSDSSILEYVVILEVKKFDRRLNAGGKENPQRQLLNYLSTLGLKRGILTNGMEWWIYDISQKVREPQIIGCNLFAMIKGESKLDEQYFYNMFEAKNFGNDNIFNNLRQRNKDKVEELESNLKK